jgi:prefoldin subunit 5
MNRKIGTYFKYAIGEILLVVVGILIAVQIDNWNEEKNERRILDDILQSIANGVQTDIRELNLLSTARTNIVKKVETLRYDEKFDTKSTINIEEASFVNFAFTNILNTIHLNTNITAYESFKNSIYFGKIQGTDLALLLETYYKSAAKIREREDQYNLSVEKLSQEWFAHYKNNEANLFLTPWNAGDFAIVGSRFLEIAKDPRTHAIWESGLGEGAILKAYEEQILMGKKLVEMIRNSETTFDQQTILEFSGIVFTFGDAEIVSLLIDGEVPTGFDLRYAASGLFPNYIEQQKGYVAIKYPPNKYKWASAYFYVNALYGRVNEMDFTAYSKVMIEMKGEAGGETFEIGMKDINDPPDGSESKIKVELTKQWKLYEFETKRFETADMTKIMVPLSFVFEGPEGKNIHIRSVQFK